MGALVRLDCLVYTLSRNVFHRQPFSASVHEDGERLCADAAQLGYLFLRQLLPPDLLFSLRRHVLEACHRLGWLEDDSDWTCGYVHHGVRIGAVDSEFVSLQRQIFSMPEFLELGRHPSIVRVFEKLFDGSARTDLGHCCRAFSPFAFDLTTRPHQDQFYIENASDLWTVWIPLGDCPANLGGLAIWPGSHRLGVLEHQGERTSNLGIAVEDDICWATGDFDCGDVLFFHGLTVHRSCDNVTDNQLRLSVDYRYQPIALAQPVSSAHSDTNCFAMPKW